MAYLTVFMLLWSATCGETACSKLICIANENEAECDIIRFVLHRLELVPEHIKPCGVAVDIQLTSGIHVLSKDLEFNKSIILHGTLNRKKSFIICSGEFEVNFRGQPVYLKDVTFKNCSTASSATLNFVYGAYTLENVVIEDSKGLGLSTSNCVIENIISSTIRRCNSWAIKLAASFAKKIFIEDSEFTDNGAGIVYIAAVSDSHEPLRLSLHVIGSQFIRNAYDALHAGEAFSLVIANCDFINNTGAAMYILETQKAEIMNVRFIGNYRALYIVSNTEPKPTLIYSISKCTFHGHNLSEIFHDLQASVIFVNTFGAFGQFKIEESIFEGNFGTGCSCLDIENSNNVVLNNILLRDNHCTGISLQGSHIVIKHWLNATRNFGKMGGAIELTSGLKDDNFSTIGFSKGARLNLVENTAELYGGGIYTDESCRSRNEKRSCFFQINRTVSSNDSAIMLTGNQAGLGGDAIFGGCLSECYIQDELINITDLNNFFYDIISLQDNPSASIYAASPEQIAFCSNKTMYPKCRYSQTINAYRGETFHVSLMISSSICFPTIGFIHARIKETERGQLGGIDGRESYKKSSKYCDTYTYAVNADLNISTVTMELLIHRETPSSFAPTLLTLVLDDCPIGYQYNSTGRKCECGDLLKSKHIRCIASTQSLEVPPLTWIGEISGRPAVSEHCQYCHIEGDTTIKSAKDANKLCTRYRKGILCGQCSGNSSLLLGGHRCGNCHNSLHKGILLMVGFAVIGVALVLLILWLNLTVSTGLINGLIFYSNIVYANHDIFFPTNQETTKSSLGTLVSLLSTFQAWMNLDFGISVCFFERYDIYTSTWMQFVFPFYIWFLILVIVLASRYSSRISRMTTSNTVSVLATLLLLSYSKLLTTSIAAVSFTDVTFLNDSSKHRVWILDGTILYLHGKHIPLFFMSLLVILIYILPFTLLILLGPILQTKSHYGLLKWINKLKPFLDSFYGPYTNRYRYWPGTLLLARIITLNIFAYYSLGDRPFKLVTVAIMIIVLLLTWIGFGKDHKFSLHHKTYLNYLELFLLIHLAIFAVSSICQFSEKHLRNQQVLAVAMGGSVFIAFCSIVIYQITCIRKAVGKILLVMNSQRKDTELTQNKDYSQNQVIRASELTDKLREPLLTE